jgi:hypothetical protein
VEKMKLVIEIDKEHYERIMRLEEGVTVYPTTLALYEAVKNGTPLPKGHGDLITKEQAIDLVEFYQLNPQHFDFVNLIDEIKDEKPIIEADGGGEDEM